VGAAFGALAEANKKVKETLLRGEQALALQGFIEDSNPAFEKMLQAIEKYQAAVRADIDCQAVQSRTAMARLGMAVIAGCGVGFALFLAFTWQIRRSISARLEEVSQALAEAFHSLRDAVGKITDSSRILAEGSSSEAASVEETSASVAEIESMVKNTCDNAESARQLGAAARIAAEEGSTQIQRMSSAMDDIKNSSDEVEKIIKTIDEIAFQTNLLALNAAVEAARAGEGRQGVCGGGRRGP